MILLLHLTFSFLLALLTGYVLGTVNPSYLISRHKGFDIRKGGSGNAGASNAVITMGKKIGAFCALFDIFKAWLAVRLGAALFPSLPCAAALCGTACILGHIFPFEMHFRGGKGLACLGGVVLATDVKLFLILLLLEAVIAFATDYICFVPITASLLFPAIYCWMTRSVTDTLIFCVASLFILLRHRQNIRRIRAGEEAHLSILWRKDERLENMYGIDRDRK